MPGREKSSALTLSSGAPNCCERPHHSGGVVGRWLDPHVEVARRSRPAVDRERVGADDEESDVTVGERSQQIEEVLIHRGTRRGDAIGPRSASRPEERDRPPALQPRTADRHDRARPGRGTRARPCVSGAQDLHSCGHYSRVTAASQPRKPQPLIPQRLRRIQTKQPQSRQDARNRRHEKQRNRNCCVSPRIADVDTPEERAAQSDVAEIESP